MAIIHSDNFSSVIGAQWTKVDTTNKFSIVDSRLYADGGLGSPVWTDPRLRDTTGRTRSSLGGVTAMVRFTNSGGGGPALSLHPNTAPTDPTITGSGVKFIHPYIWNRDPSNTQNNNLSPGGGLMRSIDYIIHILVRATQGYLVAISVPTGSAGGPFPVYPQARIIWVEDDGSDATLYDQIAGFDGKWHADRIVLFDAAELPVPLSTQYGATTASDLFTGTNGANINGRATATGSKTWTLTGTGTIQSNAARLSTAASATFNAGTAPRTITARARINASGARACITWRGTGTFASAWKFKLENTLISVHNTSGVVVQTGAVGGTVNTYYHMRIVDEGNLMRFYLNGREFLSTSSTAGATNTFVGIASDTGSGQVEFDEFSVYPQEITVPATLGPFQECPARFGAAVFTEPFTAPDGTPITTYNSQLNIRSGTWQILAGKIRMTAPSVNGIITRSVSNIGTDHGVFADITLPSGAIPDYNAGLDMFPAVFIRYSDQNNWIMARLLYQKIGSNDPSNEVEVWQNNAGSKTLIGYINLGNIFVPGSVRNLGICALGNQVSAWLDNEVVVQCTTTVTLGVNAGWGIDDNGPYDQPQWDNVTFWATAPPVIPPEPPTVTPTAPSTNFPFCIPTARGHQERLIYIRSDGMRYNLHAPPARAVLSQEGFGTPPINYVTDRAPFQHGDTVRGFSLGPRTVQLVVLHNMGSRSEYWTARQQFLDMVKPAFGPQAPQPGSLLYYLPDRRRRQLDVLLETGPGFTPSEGGWRAWSFTEAMRFVAHDPSWYDPTQRSVAFTFVSIADELEFPATYPIQFSSRDLTRTVTYEGTWVEYPTIIVAGPVTGFTINNLTTGDMLQLDTTIPDGMSATFNLRGIKTVLRSDGLNLLPFLGSDSDLTTFSLVPDPVAAGGINEITVSGTSTDSNSRVTLQWNDRFFGI